MYLLSAAESLRSALLTVCMKYRPHFRYSRVFTGCFSFKVLLNFKTLTFLVFFVFFVAIQADWFVSQPVVLFGVISNAKNLGRPANCYCYYSFKSTQLSSSTTQYIVAMSCCTPVSCFCEYLSQSFDCTCRNIVFPFQCVHRHTYGSLCIIFCGELYIVNYSTQLEVRWLHVLEIATYLIIILLYFYCANLCISRRQRSGLKPLTDTSF